jgi:hypothetical protein
MSVTTPQDHFYQIEKPQKMNRKNIVFLIIGMVIILLVSYFFWGQKAFAPIKESNVIKKINEEAVLASSAYLEINNQIPGEVIIVSKVTMTEGGWVAVHDDNNGIPGNILGAYYLPAGNHKDQIVPLLRGVTDDRSYIVVIHQDNGDRIFDYKIDTPDLDKNGEMITAGFFVVAESVRGE